MDRTHSKKILKIAAMVYLISFFVVNWNDVSWVFNYKTMAGLMSDFFNPYPSIDASTISPYFYPNRSATTTVATVAKETPQIKTAYTDKQNTLEIPQIGLTLPIIFSTTTDKSLLRKDLDKGVIYYPGSVYPGQPGQIIILGHSAPPGWPHVKHDWAFTDLEKLNVGDSIYIDLNNKQYKYVVRQKSIIKRGDDVPQNGDPSKNFLTLISCWPPGKDYQRIAVQTELQDN